MTVIAGASLFNGVILVADTRVTVQRRLLPDRHCDVAQKLIELTPTTAVGFAGDVTTAATLIRAVQVELTKRKRTDGASIRRWLPGFLRHVYANTSGARPVSMIVGSALPGRCNIIEKAKVAELVRKVARRQTQMQRHWMPGSVMGIMMQPHQLVRVGAVGNLLYALKAPDFTAMDYGPMSACAIGSGRGSARDLTAAADWLFTGMPGNDMVESMAMRQCASEFCASEGIESVGGMFPCLKIDHRGIGLLGEESGQPGKRISITYDGARGRWVQRNHVTGKEVELLRPSEIDPSKFAIYQRFDDWRDAVRTFNPLRLRRR